MFWIGFGTLVLWGAVLSSAANYFSGGGAGGGF